MIEAAGKADPDETASEVGDLLFSVVNLSRRLGVDPEQALRAATTRFDHRFRAIETDLAGKSLEEMDALWEQAKQGERRKAKGETA